jgi:hypothetical protein
VSLAYGTREVASHITCSARGKGTLWLTSVLSEPELALVASEESRDETRGIRVRWRDRDELLLFSDRQVKRVPVNR